MSIAYRVSGVFILGLALFVAAFGIGGGKAQAGGAAIECSIPLAVECDVYHPDGIANVTVTVDFGGEIGELDVVDKNFNCQTFATVSWDPIVPNFDIEVTPCAGFNLKGDDDDNDRLLRGSLVILAAEEVEDKAVKFDRPGSFKTPEKTMDICHVERDGSIEVISIPASEWPEHDAHGDGTAFEFADGSVACVFVDL